MELKKYLELQKTAFREQSSNYKDRIDRINRIGRLVLDNQEDISKSLSDDFGTRDDDWTLLADFIPVSKQIKHSKKNLKTWMKDINVGADAPFNIFGAKAYVKYEPLGVVGIIIPWNVPISLAFHAAIEAFAAGNRVMIKFSQDTPKTGKLIKELSEKYFSEDELFIVEGGKGISTEFSNLAFDHLIYTGGPSSARLVMKAAAENLTPVTLELGGKSPAVINNDANLELVTRKIIRTRYLNAGQVCISPDYVLLPEDKLGDFIKTAIDTGRSLFSEIIKNKQYTSIINIEQYERIIDYIEEAKVQNTKIVEINPNDEPLPDKASKKIPLTIIINPDESLKVTQEEIFGPILMVKTYKNLNEAIDYINSKPKPLALYYFGENEKDKELVLESTSSGGVCINDVMLQIIQDNLPFGGVGESGMGRYGGYEGFKNFSNPKSIFEQGKLAKISTHFLPPFNKKIKELLKRELDF